MEKTRESKAGLTIERVETVGLISGEGQEGDVYRVNVFLGGGRVYQMAEKRFRPKTSDSVFDQWKDPVKQVEMMDEIRRLNTERDLGLRLPEAFMLWRPKGATPRILMSELDTIPYSELKGVGRQEFNDDARRQSEVLSGNGFLANIDAFIPCRGENNRAIAVLCDLGMVVKKR